MGGEVGAEAGLGPCAGSGGSLVADLAADAGRGAGVGRDGGGVVVCLDLEHDVGELVGEAVAIALRLERLKAAHPEALDDTGVVGIGLDAAAGMAGVGVADHIEQGAFLGAAVDAPGGVEDLVAAVLGVDHREHHQLDVGRVAPEPAEDLMEIVHFLRGKGQAHGGIGRFQGPRARARAGRCAPGAGGATLRNSTSGSSTTASVMRSWIRGSRGSRSGLDRLAAVSKR